MYAQFTRVYPQTGTPRTQHVTSNVIIEPVGRERGALAVLHPGAPGHRGAAAAADHRRPLLRSLRRWHGVWRFTERRMEMELFGNLSAHLLQQFGP